MTARARLRGERIDKVGLERRDALSTVLFEIGLTLYQMVGGRH